MPDDVPDLAFGCKGQQALPFLRDMILGIPAQLASGLQQDVHLVDESPHAIFCVAAAGTELPEAAPPCLDHVKRAVPGQVQIRPKDSAGGLQRCE